MVEHPLMVQWVRSILHDGPFELYVFPASTPQLGLWYVLSCLLEEAYKRSLAANQKEYPMKWWQHVSSVTI